MFNTCFLWYNINGTNNIKKEGEMRKERQVVKYYSEDGSFDWWATWINNWEYSWIIPVGLIIIAGLVHAD